ncbi:MAG: 30S ribosomal protein S12 methylthiotransferase RimO [bacterium]
MNTKIGFISLGCPKNRVDSEVMLGILKEKGFTITSNENESDIIIINTCCFIKDAEQEALDTIQEFSLLKQKGIIKKLIVTGCLVQRYKNKCLEKFPFVDAFIGTGEIASIDKIAFQVFEKKIIKVKEPKYLYNHTTPLIKTTPFYTSYVKIADGCDNRCSYCLIPFVRGSYRSRKINSIVKEVEKLKFSKEIILVSQDTTNYGKDIYGKNKLVSLLKNLSKISHVEWIRLMYTYPGHYTEEFIKYISENSKICRYLDIPIQHISSRILKKMNRKQDKKFITNLLLKLKEKIPNISLRTSILVGFPSETEKDFEELVNFIQKIKFNKLGVFTYSNEKETPSSKIKNQISEKVKLERKDILMKIQQKISFEKNQEIVGKKIKVLIEGKKSQSLFIGRSEYDAPEIDGVVYVKPNKKNEPQIGEMVVVKITKGDEYDLYGKIS